MKCAAAILSKFESYSMSRYPVKWCCVLITGIKDSIDCIPGSSFAVGIHGN